MIGIDAKYYDDIYIWLIVLLSLVVFIQYGNKKQSPFYTNKRVPFIGGILLTLFLVFFIGLRPINGVFADMIGYYNLLWSLKGDVFNFEWNTDNILFDNYVSFLSSKKISVEFFFLSIASIYFVGIAWASSWLFPNDKMAAFLVYLGALSTFSFSVNGIKAGAAASLFLVAIAMYEKRKWLWTVVFILLSLGFHHSMALSVVAFVVCLVVKNTKWFLWFWLFCFVIALLHVSFFQILIGGLADESGAIYLMGEGETVRRDVFGGFRIDFILYSAVPIIFGCYGMMRKKQFSQKYSFLLNLYMLLNGVWMLCMYAEYTNRIAYLSWQLLPIVLIYPFLKEDWSGRQYRTFQYVAFGHLAFTLFMNYIYY